MSASDPSGELGFIHWLRQQTDSSRNRHLASVATSAWQHVLLGPGDDTAILRWPAGGNKPADCLVTTDMLLEGSCFLLDEAGPHRVGRKAMAVNLSDIAAMAGRPLAAVVSVGLPRQGGRQLAEELYLGMRTVSDAFDTPIVGGDTNSWTGPLVISITLLGEPTGSGPIRRHGARPGDRLLVTGPLGGSILGKHLDFTPRVREAMLLHQQVSLHAMIDISDGLALDLWRLCTESECGAVLHAEAIPISPEAHQLAAEEEKEKARGGEREKGQPSTQAGETIPRRENIISPSPPHPNSCASSVPLQHALNDGEDFELLFAVSPTDAEHLLNTQPIPGITLYAIGECVPEGLWLEAQGQRQPLDPSGYVHTLQ